jgi:glycosyltransferase involved in cell wall biosynthesis
VARALRPDVRVIGQNRTGKGNALACGMAAALGDVVVLLDADGSTDPGEIPAFVQALCQGADYVKGSRRLCDGGSDDLTRWRRMGNNALTFLVNTLCGTTFTDLCYGYNAVWRQHVGVFELDVSSAPQAGGGLRWGDGFEIETMLHLRAFAAGLRIDEVPSRERPRIFGESNLDAVRDGLRVLRTVLRERRRLRHRTPAPAAPAELPDVAQGLLDKVAARDMAGEAPVARPASAGEAGA